MSTIVVYLWFYSCNQFIDVKLSNTDPSAGTVFKRQISTSKVNPRTERITIFILAVDPWHRYSNEAERYNQDIYDYFKLKKTTFRLQGWHKPILVV